MQWCERINKMWRNGMKGDSAVEVSTYIGRLDYSPDVFLIMEHRNKYGKINGYSIWYQNEEYVKLGGSNFALKIKDCSSPNEGMRLCEQFYREMQDGNIPKSKGTQYFGDEIWVEGPFIEL